MNKNIKVVAIVQARTSSTRLPGKVLKDIVGKPLLWYLATRVGKAKCVDDVVIATTINEGDDILEKFAVDNNLGIYRGSENDIVDRILNAGHIRSDGYLEALKAAGKWLSVTGIGSTAIGGMNVARDKQK